MLDALIVSAYLGYNVLAEQIPVTGTYSLGRTICEELFQYRNNPKAAPWNIKCSQDRNANSMMIMLIS